MWSGVEQRNFQFVLRAFARRSGVSVTYTSAGYSVPAFRQRLGAAAGPGLNEERELALD